MSDRSTEARYRAKLAARANGTATVVVFPAGSGGDVADRYQAKLEARKRAEAAPAAPSDDAATEAADADPEKDPPREPARSERRSR